MKNHQKKNHQNHKNEQSLILDHTFSLPWEHAAGFYQMALLQYTPFIKQVCEFLRHLKLDSLEKCKAIPFRKYKKKLEELQCHLTSSHLTGRLTIGKSI